MSFLRTSRIASFLLPLAAVAQTVNPAPGGVFSQFTVNSFTGSGNVSIQAITTDAAGYVYVAGTTSAPDMTVKNAAQPVFGDGLVWRSLDRGSTWQKISSWIPGSQTVITPHPTDPQTLFLGGTNGIYKTADGGQTWRLVGPNSNGSNYSVIAVDPKNPELVYAYQPGPTYSAQSQFLASQDGGESWRATSTGPPFGLGQGPSPEFGLGATAMWVDPLGSGAIGLAGWLSKDGGLTWTNISATSAPWNLTFSVPDPRNSGWIYEGIESTSGTGELLFSMNWGQLWTQWTLPQLNCPEYCTTPALENLLPDPDTAGAFYGIDLSGAFDRSLDSGKSWQRNPDLSLSPEIAALTRECNGGALVASEGTVNGSYSKMYSSTDFGSTWNFTPFPPVLGMASGPGCALYALQATTSDAFVAKLAPGGTEVIWATFLGGSAADKAAAIEVDGGGNVYVAGNTSSSDFPVTAPRVGVQGASNAFVTKYDPNGRVQYSVVLGGESYDFVTSMAVDSRGDVYLAGSTTSTLFPVTVTPSPVQPTTGLTAFAIKLNPQADVSYISYLPIPTVYETIAVAAETGGSALYGGYDGKLYRMAADGSSLSPVSQQLGPILAMDTDSSGNIYVALTDTQSPAVQSVGCSSDYFSGPPWGRGDLVVAKLEPVQLSPVYSTRLFGYCASFASSIRVGPTGKATLSLTTSAGFPMLNPVLAAAAPATPTDAVLELSADGTLFFSSFTDSVTAAAAAPDGSLVYTNGSGGAVLSFPVAIPGGLSITGAADAFDGRSDQPTPGMLLTISGQNLASEWIDLGLNDPNPLPTQLGGVQVLFDGNPAEIMQIAPDHVICVIPWQITQPVVTVQVVNGSTSSTTPLLLPMSYGSGFQGLLTQAFPALPPSQGSVDGNIRNSDGTLNGPTNPAAPGSMVTLFGTGSFVPGSAVPLLWNSPPSDELRPSPINPYYLEGTARAMSGFIDAIYAIDMIVPASQNPGVLKRNVIGYIGTGIGIYVQ
ncbi:MAG TPA: SBBP repeat-containing protein [Bryobacteraceae bacterium]|jgi:uncharacterized protein (TIGR03437 family)